MKVRRKDNIKIDLRKVRGIGRSQSAVSYGVVWNLWLQLPIMAKC